jgi:NCS2 family nucleobase:cation symporter-2/xanthine permease XanP
MSDTPPVSSSQVLYKLEEELPFHTGLLVGLQHVLAMFVGVIAPPLILASALGFSKEETAYLLSAGLVASAIGTLIQIKRRKFLGSGMLCITGTSSAFIPVLKEIGMEGGLPLMIGMSICAAPIQILVAPFLPRLRNFFPPLVTGTFLILIGFSLVPIGFNYILQGFGQEAPRWAPLAMAGLTVMIVIACYASGRPILRLTSIVTSLGVGYALCAILGLVGAPPESTSSWVVVPVPFHFGFAFQWGLLVPIVIMYLFSSVETVGDLTAVSEFSEEPTSGDVFWKRIRGGILADGFNSLMAGMLSSFPNTSFSQNNGVIQLTGVAARRVGYFVAFFMLLFGLFPPIGRWVAVTPPPVLGAITVVVFGFIIVAGIRIVAGNKALGHRSVLILAIALGVGIGLQAKPEILTGFPNWVRLTFGTPFVTGGMLALFLNAVMPNRVKESVDSPETATEEVKELKTENAPANG